MIKAIIFDVGGVLTSRRGRTFVKKYHKKFGMDPEELHLAFHDFYSIDYEFGKKNDDWFLNGIRKNLKNIISKKELRKYWFLCNKVDKGMIRFAKKLKKEYKIGILSNSLPIFTKDLRNKMDLNLFDVVVFSDEVKMKKPNKEIFDYVVKKLKLNPGECLFVDDQEQNIKAAKNFGWKAILFKGLGELKKELENLSIKI